MPQSQHNTIEYSRAAAFAAPRVAPWIEKLAAPGAMGAAIVVGIACRVAQYLANRSFWTDESMLVLNIRAKSAAELLGKLDYNQAAPPIFLLVERGMYRAFGGSEFVLRLMPLACGIASVLLFVKLARRILSPPWSLLAVAIFACSDRLIWHACEVKPYSGDVLATIILLLAVAPGGASAERRMLRLAGCAAVLLWFSYPCVFVFAGASLALWPSLWREGRRGITVWAGAIAMVMISFFALLHFSVQAQHTSSLADYWAEHFVDMRHPLTIPLWLVRRFLSMCTYACAPAGPVVLFGGFFGVALLLRQGRLEAVRLLLLPILMTLLAAAAQRYPFDGARLTGFLTPIVILLAALGVEFLEQAASPAMQWTGLISGAAMLAVAAGLAAFHLVSPRMRDHVRPVTQYLSAHAQASDGIYVICKHEFDCYWPAGDWRVHYALDRADRVPFRRFWLVASYPNQTERKRLQPLLKWASLIGKQRESFVGIGGGAWLFEKTGEAPPGPVEPPAIGEKHKAVQRAP